MLLHLRRAGMIKPTDSFIGKELFGLVYNEKHEDLKLWF